MATYKKSEATKSKIAVTAAQLFADKGYKSTTIREICAVSGVSQSRINYHFTGKKELASEILRTTLAAIDGRIADNVSPQDEPPLDYAALYIRLWLGAFLAEDKYVRFCADLTDDGVFSRPIYEVFKCHFEDVNQRLSLGIAEIDLMTDAIVFVSSLSSFIKGKHEGLWTRSNDVFCDVFVELFLKLLFVPRERIATILPESLRRKNEMPPLRQ